MRLSWKIIIGLWIGLLIGMTFLFYNAYSALRPESFIQLLSEQVEKNYPGTELEVAGVDYRISVDFNIVLNNLTLRRKGTILSTLKEIELRVPWWLLLFKKGNAQINLTSLEIYIDNSKSKSVPSSSLGPKKTDQAPQVRLEVPDYLSEANFTLRAKDISIKDSATLRRYLTLSKILVREFQYGKNSAFELNIPIIISHNGVELTTELWLFGDVTPLNREWNLNYRGEFRSKEGNEKFQMDDFILDGKANFSPHQLHFSSQLEIVVDKERIGSGQLLANNIEFSTGLEFSKFPLEYIEFFADYLKNPYLDKFQGTAEGTLKATKSHKKSGINFLAKLNFPGSFSLGGKEKVAGKWRLALENNRWDSSFISPKGEVSLFRRSFFDPKRGSISQFSEEIGFTDIDADIAFESILPLKEIMDLSAQTYFATVISLKNCSWDDKKLEGNVRYGISPGNKYFQTHLIENDNELKLDYHNSGQLNKLSVSARKFSLNDKIVFLAPFLIAKEGEITGNFDGRWTEGNWELGEWMLKLRGSGLKGLKGHLLELDRSFWGFFGLVTDTELDQQWDIFARNGLLKVDSMMMEGGDPAKITGQIDLSFKSKSQLHLKYLKNKKWKVVRKEVTGPFWKKEGT